MDTTLPKTYQGQLNKGQIPASVSSQYAPSGSPVYGSSTVAPGYSLDARIDGNGNSYNVSVPKVSTTTISNGNKMDAVPGIVNKTNQLTDTGVRTDPNTGNATLANGSAYTPPQGLNDGTSTADTSAEDAAIQRNIEAMKASTDATTADMLASIERKFAQRKSEQQAVNQRQGAAVTNALLRGGVTGQGSSAQYAPVSSQGIIGTQEGYGIHELADLDSQEQDLITQAKAAKSAADYKLLETKNTQIEAKRKEKIDAATKLNDTIIEQNKKIREQQIQSSRDSAVADLYSQGVTDPSKMLEYLNGNGGDFTLKEVSDSIKDLVPSGLDDLVKTLRNNGAPSDVLQKVLSSGNMNDAYASAGNYASGGSGIIGEYNYYKAQAEEAGQTPVDFNAYQNQDANRKIKIAAAANASGLTTTAMNTAMKLSDDYESRSKDYYQQREAYNRIQSSAADPSPAGDLALIFNYMKVLDPGSTVREGEFANAQNAGSAFTAIGAQYNKVVNGQRLTEKQRADFLDRANKLFNGAKQQQDSVVDEFKVRANKYGVPDDLVVRDTSATGSNAQEAIKTEEDAKNIVVNVSKANPDAAKAIRTALGQGVAYIDIISAFPEYFKK